jgi:hypothetical protein
MRNKSQRGIAMMSLLKKTLILIVLFTALGSIKSCFGLAMSFYYGAIDNLDIYLIGDCHIDESDQETANKQYSIIKAMINYARAHSPTVSFLVESCGHPDGEPQEPDDLDEITQHIYPTLKTLRVCNNHKNIFSTPEEYENSKKELFSSLIYKCSQIPNACLLDIFPAACDFFIELEDNKLGNLLYEIIYQNKAKKSFLPPQTSNLKYAIIYAQKSINTLSVFAQSNVHASATPSSSLDTSSHSALALTLQKKAFRYQQNILQPLIDLATTLNGASFIDAIVNAINLESAYEAQCFICNLKYQLSTFALYEQCKELGHNIAMRRHNGSLLEAEAVQHIISLQKNNQQATVFIFAGASHCQNLMSMFLPPYGFKLLYAAGETTFKSLTFRDSQPSLIAKSNKIVQGLIKLISYRFNNPAYEPLPYHIPDFTTE